MCQLIKIVAKWKSLKGKDKMLVRVFNLRCIGRAYVMDSVKQIEYMMISILSVGLSKTIGFTVDGKSLISNERMQYLNNIIKGNVNYEINSIINDDNEDENQEIESFLSMIQIT